MDREIIADWVKHTDTCTSTDERISAALVIEHPSFTVEKVKRVVDAADADPGFPLHRYKGGSVLYTGNDADGLYRTVTRVSKAFFREAVGLRDIEIVESSHGGTKHSGAWVHPDLVMRAYPKKRASRSDPYDLHAIEVEHATGFDLRSVYQAFEQARGADFAWVVFNLGSTTDSAMKRIEQVAIETGVGLIRFEKPTVRATWSMVVEAKRQPYNRWTKRTELVEGPARENGRRGFLDNSVGPKLERKLFPSTTTSGSPSATTSGPVGSAT